jgi:small subunit ribosomal protein S21
LTRPIDVAYDRYSRPSVEISGRSAIGGSVSEVVVGDSESLEAALRRFTKRVQADGILTDARRHEYYEKPSERRKKKEAARRRKLRKAIARQRQTRPF